MTSSCTAVPSVGSIIDNGNGTITYTPPINFVGSVTITCTVTDNNGATSQSSATVNVSVTNVNDAPVAADDTAQVNQNRSNPVTNKSVLIQVLANDTDIDAGDTLTPATVSNPPTAPQTSRARDRYTPDPDFIGIGHVHLSRRRQSRPVQRSNRDGHRVRVMCSGDEVTAVDGQVEATFVLLTPGFCKPYTLDAVPSSSSSCCSSLRVRAKSTTAA